MPYGRTYRKKARKVVRTAKGYARTGGKLGKNITKRVVGKFVPGYNVYSTADDIWWAGNKAYRYMKNRQVNRTDSHKDRMGSNNSGSNRGGRKKRYGIDDYY